MAEEYADRVAVSSDTETHTYASLQDWSERIAAELTAGGVNRGDRVGLHLPASPLWIVAMLAVLKCGAAYVPLDPATPLQRRQFISSDAALALVLGEEFADGEGTDLLGSGPSPRMSTDELIAAAGACRSSVRGGARDRRRRSGIRHLHIMSYRPEDVNNLVNDGLKRGFFGYDYRELQKDPNWKPDESKAFPVVMKKGQSLIFWSTLMHASLPNITDNDYRMGFATRYVPPTVKVYPDTELVEEYGGAVPLDNWAAVLVSGSDEAGINRLADTNRRGYRFT